MTARNVEDFAQQLFQRRSVHVTWFLNRYQAQKRFAKRKAAEAPPAAAEDASAFSSEQGAV